MLGTYEIFHLANLNHWVGFCLGQLQSLGLPNGFPWGTNWTLEWIGQLCFMCYFVAPLQTLLLSQQHRSGNCPGRQTLVRKDATILWSLMSRQWLVVFDLFPVADLLSYFSSTAHVWQLPSTGKPLWERMFTSCGDWWTGNGWWCLFCFPAAHLFCLFQRLLKRHWLVEFTIFLVPHLLRPAFEQQHTFGNCFYRQTLVRKDVPILWGLMSRQWLVVFDVFLVADLLSFVFISSTCLATAIYRQAFVRKDVPKLWCLVNRQWLMVFDLFPWCAFVLPLSEAGLVDKELPQPPKAVEEALASWVCYFFLFHIC